MYIIFSIETYIYTMVIVLNMSTLNSWCFTVFGVGTVHIIQLSLDHSFMPTHYIYDTKITSEVIVTDLHITRAKKIMLDCISP